MLLAALVWVFTQIAMVGMPFAAGSAAVAGQSIVICTGSGLKTITLDAEGNPVETPSQTVECPVCAQIGGIGQIPDPAQVVVLVAGRASDLNTGPEQSLVRADFSGDLFDSRAPPHLARL